MGNLQKIVYLSQAEYETLVTNGTITKDGVTITYSQDDLYITPEPEPNYCGWYTGTAITGTSETAAIFSDSGITYAMVGDMYLNTSTNNTYRCTEEGDAANAKWIYVNNIQGDIGPAGSEYTVLVQSTEPTEASNKLWIPSGTNGVAQQVPTVEDINAVHERMDVIHSMVNYGYGYENLLEESDSTTQYKRVGVIRNGTQITLNGTSGSADLRIRLTGTMVRTTSNDSVDSWTNGLTLISGHQYKITMRYISGTITNTNSYYPGSRIYKVGTHTSEGSVTIDEYSSERVYTADNDAVNIVLYVYANTTLTNVVYEVLLEDMTASEMEKLKSTIAIVCPGDAAPQAITSGQYVIWHGVSYKATANIASGETLSTSTNLEVVPNGGLNALASSIPVKDVQINGTSVVQDGVANVPVAGNDSLGVIKHIANRGLFINSSGGIQIDKASDAGIKAANSSYYPIVTADQHKSTFYGLAKAAGDSTQSSSSNSVGTYTNDAKAAIKSMLGIYDSTEVVTVSGSTPSITAQPNTRYVCGEVSTLSFTPSSSGICDIRFTSGTSATILTIPNTVKFPSWFDPTSLETSTIYEINVEDGVYGVVSIWDV